MLKEWRQQERICMSITTRSGHGSCRLVAVSRTIAEAHGGQLWFENDMAGSASLNLALPLSHASP
jgi:signal transduction histidine kinase